MTKMISPIFNDFSYEILPKQKETWDRYCKILQWGRRHPTRFCEDFIGLQLTDYQKYIFLNCWSAMTAVVLCSRATGKATSLDTKVWALTQDNRVTIKTIGELQVGDKIYDRRLKMVEVIQLHPIIFDCYYEITFNDGEVIKCNEDHLWFIAPNDDILSTKEIYDKVINGEQISIPLVMNQGYKSIIKVEYINHKIPMRCITVNNTDGSFLCGDKLTVTHNSFFSAPFIMTRSLLIPYHKTYIMSISGGQASATFSKLEDLANNNIASVIGVSSVFLDNVVKQNAKVSGFTHDKAGMHVELFNGSEVTSLNSVPDNLRGARSNLNLYDEAAFIPKELYTATLPFTAVSADFRTSKDLNPELYPKQIPNLNLFLSSASDISSEMFAQYKEAFRQMMLGNTAYFVADLDYHQSIAPFLNGKPMKPLVTIEEVERMYATQPYKAEREFGNKWSGDQGEDVLVKRTTLEKFSTPFYPTFSNDGEHQYVICYDPSSRQDNSVILVAEIVRDEQKGLMLKLVNMQNLVEQFKNGQVGVIQRPEQVEILKGMMLDYNRGFVDYEGLSHIYIDAGSGGGGFEVGQYLLTDFTGKDNKIHRGIIDLENEYMEVRADDYPGAAQILTLFNFKRDKTAAYEATASAINQGLVMFPKGLNIRNEIEFEEEKPDGSMVLRYEKPNLQEANVLIQLDLAKEELMGIQKSKRPNGTIVFEATPEAKSNNLHDDRADCIAMACYHLMQLRADEALKVEHTGSDFTKVFHTKQKKTSKNHNPFYDKKRGNPFHRDVNPFD